MFKSSYILTLCALSASTLALPQGLTDLVAPPGGSNIDLKISSWSGPNCPGSPLSVTNVLYDTDAVTATTVVSYKINRVGDTYEQIDFSTFRPDHKGVGNKAAQCMQFLESIHQETGSILPNVCYNIKNGASAQVSYSGLGPLDDS